jgi:DUF917 family protein
LYKELLKVKRQIKYVKINKDGVEETQKMRIDKERLIVEKYEKYLKTKPDNVQTSNVQTSTPSTSHNISNP